MEMSLCVDVVAFFRLAGWYDDNERLLLCWQGDCGDCMRRYDTHGRPMWKKAVRTIYGGPMDRKYTMI